MYSRLRIHLLNKLLTSLPNTRYWSPCDCSYRPASQPCTHACCQEQRESCHPLFCVSSYWVKVKFHVWVFGERMLEKQSAGTSVSKHGLSVQFSCSVMSDSATPWTAACQASLSITNSRSLLKLMPTESVMPSSHLILCRPLLLLPQSFPAWSLLTTKMNKLEILKTWKGVHMLIS